MARRPTLTIGTVALLATVAYLVLEPRRTARDERARTTRELENLHSAVRQYAIRNNGYPVRLEQLLELDMNTRGPFTPEELPLDPWGRPYVYIRTAHEPRLLTYGADGIPGGSGRDADIER